MFFITDCNEFHLQLYKDWENYQLYVATKAKVINNKVENPIVSPKLIGQ